jgi:hypothetical protein
MGGPLSLESPPAANGFTFGPHAHRPIAARIEQRICPTVGRTGRGSHASLGVATREAGCRTPAHLGDVNAADAVVGPCSAQRDAAADAVPLWFVVAMLLSRIAAHCVGTDPAVRSAEIGKGLVQLSRVPIEAIRGMVGAIDGTRRDIMAARLSAELRATPEACAAWRDGVKERIAKFGAIATAAAPRELAAAGDAAWSQLRAALTRYGHLLVAWPRLIAAARERRLRIAA